MAEASFSNGLQRLVVRCLQRTSDILKNILNRTFAHLQTEDLIQAFARSATRHLIAPGQGPYQSLRHWTKSALSHRSRQLAPIDRAAFAAAIAGPVFGYHRFDRRNLGGLIALDFPNLVLRA